MLETIGLSVLLAIASIVIGLAIVVIMAYFDKPPVSESPKPRDYPDFDFWEQNEYWGE